LEKQQQTNFPRIGRRGKAAVQGKVILGRRGVLQKLVLGFWPLGFDFVSYHPNCFYFFQKSFTDNKDCSRFNRAKQSSQGYSGALYQNPFYINSIFKKL